MPTDVDRWAIDLRVAAKRLGDPGVILKLQKQLVFLTLGAAVEVAPGRFRRISGVVLLTPVDTGRARASWNVSVGSPSLAVPRPGRYQKRPGKVAEARGVLSGLGKYQTVWVTSNLPYIRVLEYGEYPNPPERGSWDRRRGEWVVRSVGGYSRQAPHGMVGVTYYQILFALREVA